MIFTKLYHLPVQTTTSASCSTHSPRASLLSSPTPITADHDFRISRDDLLRYGNDSLTYRIVDRIFSQVRYRLAPLLYCCAVL